MASNHKIFSCRECALPIHAEDAAYLTIPRCRCDGIRTVDMIQAPRSGQPSTAMRVGLGVIASLALTARQADTVVCSAQLERSLQTAVPMASSSDSSRYARLVLRR